MRWKTLTAVLALAAATTPGRGQDRDAMLERVQRESARAAAPGTTAAERNAALDRAIEARAELMREHSTDAHRPIWLLDQAADTLARLSVAMADARLAVGVMDRRERARAVVAAEEAYVMADTAGAMIRSRFEAQQRVLDEGGELAEGDRTLNRRLAETEEAVRRPLLMGRAMALQVAGDGELADARTAIELLDGLRLGPGEARMVRDTALAVALAEGGSGEGRRRAAAVLDRVLEAQDASDTRSLALAEAALLRARLADGPDAQAAAIEAAADRPPFVGRDGLRDAALLVLAIEARARVLAEGGRLESAARTIMGLADRRDLGGTPQQWNGLVDERLAALAEAAPDWNAVSPDVVLRAARALVAQDRPALDDQASEMLAALLDRFEAAKARAVKAGEAWAEPAEAAPAAEFLARLDIAAALRAGEAGRAGERRRRAVALVWDLLDAPGADLSGLLPQAATLAMDAAGSGLDAARRRDLLEAALQRVPTDPNTDRWRLGLAAMLMEGGGPWPRALELAEAAMRSPDPATSADATALAGAAHGLLVARAGGDDLPTLRRALAFVRAHPAATDLDAGALGVRVARAYVGSSAADARVALDALQGAQGSEAIVLRARALDTLGNAEEAFAEYLAASGRLTPSSDDYWLVWTRLLEMSNARREKHLAAGRSDAARAIQTRIRGHLLHLKAIDAGLGGPQWSRQLSAVEASLEP